MQEEPLVLNLTTTIGFLSPSTSDCRIYIRVLHSNILHFTEPLEDGFHSYLHGKGAKGTLQEAYNGQVRRWLDTNPSASQAEFLEEVNRLRDEYMALYASYIIGQ